MALSPEVKAEVINIARQMMEQSFTNWEDYGWNEITDKYFGN